MLGVRNYKLYNLEKYMARKERTITEVYNVLTDFITFTKHQFEVVEKRFELVNGQLHLMSKEIRDIKVEQQETGKDIKMLKEDVVAVGKSIYKQHRTLETHSRRLVKLEQ